VDDAIKAAKEAERALKKGKDPKKEDKKKEDKKKEDKKKEDKKRDDKPRKKLLGLVEFSVALNPEPPAEEEEEA
jgi:hypothetical protein